ncbi:hypothetical protein CDD81_2110 [Ophiocordyceps australis]|uniref:Uncharacterized protein n=1 Tax=Ophiocordyceps australis TaxID=1399860 RepID=A0A2C5XEX2_9HYPO|nr:hypothetical protein CDD81_2110 [Ophiocordyceps australis]
MNFDINNHYIAAGLRRGEFRRQDPSDDLLESLRKSTGSATTCLPGAEGQPLYVTDGTAPPQICRLPDSRDKSPERAPNSASEFIPDDSSGYTFEITGPLHTNGFMRVPVLENSKLIITTWGRAALQNRMALETSRAPELVGPLIVKAGDTGFNVSESQRLYVEFKRRPLSLAAETTIRSFGTIETLKPHFDPELLEELHGYGYTFLMNGPFFVTIDDIDLYIPTGERINFNTWGPEGDHNMGQMDYYSEPSFHGPGDIIIGERLYKFPEGARGTIASRIGKMSDQMTIRQFGLRPGETRKKPTVGDEEPPEFGEWAKNKWTSATIGSSSPGGSHPGGSHGGGDTMTPEGQGWSRGKSSSAGPSSTSEDAQSMHGVGSSTTRWQSGGASSGISGAGQSDTGHGGDADDQQGWSRMQNQVCWYENTLAYKVLDGNRPTFLMPRGEKFLSEDQKTKATKDPYSCSRVSQVTIRRYCSGSSIRCTTDDGRLRGRVDDPFTPASETTYDPVPLLVCNDVPRVAGIENGDLLCFRKLQSGQRVALRCIPGPDNTAQDCFGRHPEFENGWFNVTELSLL